MQYPPEQPGPYQQTGYGSQGNNGGNGPYPTPSEQLGGYPQQGNPSGQPPQNPSGPNYNVHDDRTQYARPGQQPNTGPYGPMPQPNAGPVSQPNSGPYAGPVSQPNSNPYNPYPYLPPPPPPAPKPLLSRLPKGIMILLIALVVLLIGGSGLIYFATVYQPNQLHAQATATANAQAKGTADAQSTSTAHAVQTTTAQNDATATVVTQATAQVAATQTAIK